MSNTDLLDLETWVQLRKAAPKVTAVPFDGAQAGVRALTRYMKSNQPHADLDGRKYWEATLKDLVAAGDLPVKPAALGHAFRPMGLTLWREADGYHVAWSEAQFNILKRYFRA